MTGAPTASVCGHSMSETLREAFRKLHGSRARPWCPAGSALGADAWLPGIILAICLGIGASAEERTAKDAAGAGIVAASGVKGGLVVHLGADHRLTEALRIGDAFAVHALDRDANNVQAARQRLSDAGKYGE